MVAILAGAGIWMVNTILPVVSNAVVNMAMVFSLSGIIHLVLLLPIFALRMLSSRLTGIVIR
jgi:hypothetical protein